MARIPFGVSRLDRLVGGGSPAGSLVLLTGEPGAGAREFLITSAVMNGLAKDHEDLFDLHYGSLPEEATVPSDIHYISFTGGRESIESEVEFVMSEELATAGMSTVRIRDLSPEYFQLSPVPREWYAGVRQEIGDLGASDRQNDVVEALAAYLEEHGNDSLICVDSLTDLVGVTETGAVDWSDLVYMMKGLRRAVRSWGGLIIVHTTLDSMGERRLADLMASVDGTMVFEWERGGNELARTMAVREFRGVLAEIEEEDITRFETEIHEAGFDISDVRKIR